MWAGLVNRMFVIRRLRISPPRYECLRSVSRRWPPMFLTLKVRLGLTVVTVTLLVIVTPITLARQHLVRVPLPDSPGRHPRSSVPLI